MCLTYLHCYKFNGDFCVSEFPDFTVVNSCLQLPIP